MKDERRRQWRIVQKTSFEDGVKHLLNKIA
jgi:hypothetical protein